MLALNLPYAAPIKPETNQLNQEISEACSRHERGKPIGGFIVERTLGGNQEKEKSHTGQEGGTNPLRNDESEDDELNGDRNEEREEEKSPVITVHVIRQHVHGLTHS